MTTLKRTPLRHKMLSEIAAGKMRLYQGIHLNLVRSVGGATEFMRGAEKRCEMDVLPLVQKPSSPSSWNSARLTGAGRALLATWDAKHGKAELD